MTLDKIIEIGRKSGMVGTRKGWVLWDVELEKFAAAVAAAEREACAKVCEKQDGLHDHIYAEAIRARGEQ